MKIKKLTESQKRVNFFKFLQTLKSDTNRKIEEVNKRINILSVVRSGKSSRIFSKKKKPFTERIFFSKD